MAAILDLFAQIIGLCRQLNMVIMGHISSDGSKFKANAADHNSYDQKRLDKQIRRILDEVDNPISEKIDCMVLTKGAMSCHSQYQIEKSAWIN